MFDNPSRDSWNPKVSTAPSHGLYLYDIGYDEADLALPIEPVLEQQTPIDEAEITLDLKKEIIKARMLRRKVALEARAAKSFEKVRNHELLRSVEK